MKRYFVALGTSTGAIITGIITGDFDEGIKKLIEKHKKGDITAILKVEELPPPNDFQKGD